MERIKVFLSHPMSSMPEKDVLALRRSIMEYLDNKYKDVFEIEYIENYYHEDAPKDIEKSNPLWHLGRSIQQLGEADFIYFVDCNLGSRRNESKGIIVEKLIKKLYNIPVLE